MPLYYIWSFEHRAFWAPNREGYTPDVRLAGKYREDIAAQIVEQARGDEIAFVVTGITNPSQWNKPGQEPAPDVIVYDLKATFAFQP